MALLFRIYIDYVGRAAGCAAGQQFLRSIRGLPGPKGGVGSLAVCAEKGFRWGRRNDETLQTGTLPCGCF